MSPLDAAIQALREDRPLDAEAIVVDAVILAETTYGPQSPESAHATFNLASFLATIGDLTRGINALRRSTQMTVTTDEDERDRLTYMMNLGEFMGQAGRFEEAEEVLRDGLIGRAQFYGLKHPGYAYGLEPLAGVLLAMDRTQEAASLLEQALAILVEADHPRQSAVFAARAYATKAGWGPTAPALLGLDELSDERVVDTVRTCIGQSNQYAADSNLALLTDLRPIVAARFEQTDLQRDLLIAITNTARRAGDHHLRAAVFEDLLELIQPSRRLDVLLGWAMALDDDAQVERSEAIYAQALSEAVGAASRSHVTRNFGLFLSSHNRPQALSMLQTAVAEARRADHDELLGRALVAIALFRQHTGELTDARTELIEGLGHLPVQHPDALSGRSHLSAIEAGHTCGCGNMLAALSSAFDTLIRAHFPDGLLESAGIIEDDDGQRASIELARSPTDSEQILLERVIHQALAQLRNHST